MTIQKDLVLKRFKKCIKTYDDNAFMQYSIVDTLLKILVDNVDLSKTKRIFEIGAGSGFFTKKLLAVDHFKNKNIIYYINDMVEDYSLMYDQIDYSFRKYMGDVESIDCPKNLDLILSSSTLQWIQNKEKVLNKAYDCMNVNSHLLFSTFSKKNFQELRDITGNGLDYLDLDEIKDVLGKKFSILLIKEKEIEIEFNNPLQILLHLKTTGVNGIDNVFWKKSDLENFCAEYTKKYSTEENKVILTYHPLWFLAKKN